LIIEVLTPLQVKLRGRLCAFHQGQKISLPDEVGQKLMQKAGEKVRIVYPQQTDRRHPSIPKHIHREVARIEKEAISKGWPQEFLWNREFWNIGADGRNRPGLVAILLPMRPGTQVKTVEKDVLTLRYPSGREGKIFHPDHAGHD